MTSLSYEVPTADEITSAVEEHFDTKPCKFQIEAAIAQLSKTNEGIYRRGVVCVAGTGSGKSLAFFIPFLFNDNGISIMVTPLTALGKQMAFYAAKLKISVANLTGGTQTGSLLKEIEDGVHRLIIISPETIQKNIQFREIFKSTAFTSRLFSIIFDEAHCISQWGDSFRPHYAQVADLGDLVPLKTLFYITSATMPDIVLKDVLSKLRLDKDPKQVTEIHLSNDRPNIYLEVWRMDHPHSSFRDLSFLVPSRNLVEDPPPKFLVFFDSKNDAQKAVNYLQSLLPKEDIDKIVWFHSGMSEDFRTEAIENLRTGKIYGLCCTDAAGMGIDISNINITVQWKAPKTLCTLSQRLGRAVRDKSLIGRGILIAEPKNFDDEIAKAADREKEKEAAGKKSISKPRPNKRKAEDDACEEAVIDYINAENRSSCANCRRRLKSNYFGNNKRRRTNYDCCERCSVSLLPFCCDLCSANINMDDIPENQRPPPVRRDKEQSSKQSAPRKLRPKYEPGPADRKLSALLRKWRYAEYIERYGGDVVFGPSIVMSDEILQRIVDVSHVGKINSIQDILDQTQWTKALAVRYGPRIIEIVKSVRPDTATLSDETRTKYDSNLPLQSTTKTNQFTAQNASTGTAEVLQSQPAVAKWTCSACGVKGHSARSKKCKLYDPNKARKKTSSHSDTQNIPPKDSTKPPQADSTIASSSRPSYRFTIRSPSPTPPPETPTNTSASPDSSFTVFESLPSNGTRIVSSTSLLSTTVETNLFY